MHMSASVAVVALLASGCVAVAAVLLANRARESTPSPPRRPPPDGADSGWRGVMLRRINEERRKAGVPSLCLNSKLNAAAQAHSADQAALGKSWTHTGSDGSNPCQRIQRAGYSFAACGENVAELKLGVQDVMNGWMNSPGHRANLLSRTYRQVGLGRESTAGGTWWTQSFASSSSERCEG